MPYNYSSNRVIFRLFYDFVLIHVHQSKFATLAKNTKNCNIMTVCFEFESSQDFSKDSQNLFVNKIQQNCNIFRNPDQNQNVVEKV